MTTTQAQIEAAGDLVQKLTDHAALIRKMDAIANADRMTQSNEATAELLNKAARVIGLYRARYPLTAAAEVGEQSIVARTPALDAETAVIVGVNIEAATIERCALVLDEYFGSSENLLSRRIRALKDKS